MPVAPVNVSGGVVPHQQGLGLSTVTWLLQPADSVAAGADKTDQRGLIVFRPAAVGRTNDAHVRPDHLAGGGQLVVLAKSNAELVCKAARLLRDLGGSVASASDAREMLNLKRARHHERCDRAERPACCHQGWQH